MDGHNDAIVTITACEVPVTLEIRAELVELANGNVQGLLQNGPLDTFCAGWSREGALV